MSLCWLWWVVVFEPCVLIFWHRLRMQASLCVKPHYACVICLWHANINFCRCLHCCWVKNKNWENSNSRTVFSATLMNKKAFTDLIPALWGTVMWHMKHLFHQHPFFLPSCITYRKANGRESQILHVGQLQHVDTFPFTSCTTRPSLHSSWERFNHHRKKTYSTLRLFSPISSLPSVFLGSARR